MAAIDSPDAEDSDCGEFPDDLSATLSISDEKSMEEKHDIIFNNTENQCCLRKVFYQSTISIKRKKKKGKLLYEMQ